MRASWKVNYCVGGHGPYVIQLATTHHGLTSYRTPLPQHRNLKSRTDAEEIRKKLPTPIIRKGIVIDGVTISGIAY